MPVRDEENSRLDHAASALDPADPHSVRVASGCQGKGPEDIFEWRGAPKVCLTGEK